VSALKGERYHHLPRIILLTNMAGVGVKAVIARSFAFIYGRNQPSLGLLGISMTDDAFYAAATENEEITIDVPSRIISVGGQKFKFELSEMEYNLTVNKGVTASYRKFGKGVWERFTGAGKDEEEGNIVRAAVEGSKNDETEGKNKMEW
jgi:hypothetical protein